MKNGCKRFIFAMRTSIDGDYPMDYCTFREGESGGSLLKISWTAMSSNVFQNPIFPTNTWGGQYNVSRSISNGSVTFYNATGDFAGESFENDANGTIHWNYSAIPNSPQNVQIQLSGSEVQLTWDAVSELQATMCIVHLTLLILPRQN